MAKLHWVLIALIVLLFLFIFFPHTALVSIVRASVGYLVKYLLGAWLV